MIRFIAGLALIFGLNSAVAAQSVAPIDTLFRALGLPEIIEIMREEGVAYGLDLENDLFGGRIGANWAATVDEIYDIDWMTDTVRNRMDGELAADDLAGMIAFFSSVRGQRIVQLEVSARRAMLDDSIDAASRETLADMIAKDDPRLTLLRAFADASALVDNNVVGALNANYAFYDGLATGGAFGKNLSEEEILSDVWSQEPEIRAETEEWVLSYLALAYQPLSDEDLQVYTDFFTTRDGTSLNLAIFVAFDELFVGLSRALGQNASRYLSGQEL